jgi:hypothetical protein
MGTPRSSSAPLLIDANRGVGAPTLIEAGLRYERDYRRGTDRSTGRLAQMKLTIDYSSRARAIG